MQVIFLQKQNKISSLSWSSTRGLSSTRLQSQAPSTATQHMHSGLLQKIERASAVSGIKHSYFHTPQASFSPKALHCIAEDTISNSRKTQWPKTSIGSFKDMTRFPSILVIQWNGSYIKRKYQKLLLIQKFYIMRTVEILAGNKSSKTE